VDAGAMAIEVRLGPIRVEVACHRHRCSRC
jgi:hypothetical protein